MPRPTRMEYQGAFHHVMNRGRNKQAIFHDESYFKEFIKTLKEVSEQLRNRGQSRLVEQSNPN